MSEGNGKRRQSENSLILGGFLFSGAAALIYEVTWTRALSLVLGSTVYALSTMLSTFMGGLAIGAYLCGKYCDRNKNLLFAFGLCELGIGISGLLSIPIIYSLPSLYIFIYKTFHPYPPLFFALQVFLCVLVMLVPTSLMGATFPLVSRRITDTVEEMGEKVGNAYSLNTLGAIVGSITAGFMLIPGFGLKGAAIVAAALNTFVAAVMIRLSGKGALRPIFTGGLLLLVAGLWLSVSEHTNYLLNFHTANRQSIRHFVENMDDYDVEQVHHEETAQGQVRAFKTDTGALMLQVGGRLEGTGPGDFPNALLLAYLPIAMHPEAESFLNIGLGAGITLAAARDYVMEVDLVEINPGVVRAVREHGIRGLLDGMAIIKNDARNYLLRTSKKYDIISSQPSYPTDSAVSSLFTKEFFEIAASRLKPHGLLCQWLPFNMLRNEGVNMMIKTFGEVFPNTYVWRVESTGDIILTGSKDFIPFDREEIATRVMELSPPGFALYYTLLKSPEKVYDIVHDRAVPVNTDDHPLVEFCAVNNFLKPLND